MTVKELRALTGLSQSKFAAYLGMNVRTLQDWESGRYKPKPYEVTWIERILVLEGMIQKPGSTGSAQPTEK